MTRILIFGNSGSGKSTYAKQLCVRHNLAHLDLDTLAWLNTTPPARKPISDSRIAIELFINEHSDWVIEGCYADLIELAIASADEIIFLNPGTDTCISNARIRPWEPHKYRSPEAQNANLDMLINWIKDYDLRTDEFSLASHRRLFNSFSGKKTEFTSNERSGP